MFMPAGFCFEQPTEGATLAIVVGSLNAETVPTLLRYRAILWFVSPLDRATWPAGLPEPFRVVEIPVSAPNVIDDALEAFVRRDPLRLPTVLLGAAVMRDAAAADALGTITPALRRILTNRVTRQRDGFFWQRNILSNLSAYARRRLPAEWAGALAGFPAVVCGAGPSLDLTGPLLKNWASRAVVFSADSALGALARQGVVADFGVSVDVSKVPQKCLECVPEPPRWLVLANLSPPSWSQVPVAGGIVFCSSRQVTVDWLQQQGVARTLVPVVDNCGVTALALARFLGCAPIYLLGMDQSLDENDAQRRHFQGVNVELYTQSGFNAEMRHPRVPGNYALTVPTHIQADWQALNNLLDSWPQGLVVNVTDRGARLNNTTLMAPGDWRLPAGGDAKAPRLEGLTLLSPPEEPLAAILMRVRAVAQSRLAQIEAFAAMVAKGGPPLAKQGFRELFMDADFASLMGAFSLKLMPYLSSPFEGDVGLWEGLVAECLELTRLAAQLEL